MQLTKTTTYSMEVDLPDGGTLTFEPEGPMPEPHDDHVSVVTDGNDYIVGWLVHDCDARDLMEWDDLNDDPKEWINGVFRDFRNSHDGGGQEARDDFYNDLVAKVGQDRVFVVDVYSHGLEHFSVANTQPYPDRRWDVAPACVLAVPPDVTNPREWADGTLEAYSNYVNGDVWIAVHHRVSTDGTVTAWDCCGGYIGRDNAESALLHESSV